MAELKPFEVIMKIDFGANDGVTAVAHAEKVAELVRCKDCIYYIKEKSFGKEYGYCDAVYQQLEGDLIGVTFQPDEDYFCAYGEKK